MQSFQDLIIKRLLAKVDLKGHFVTAPNNVKKKKPNNLSPPLFYGGFSIF